jgi:hypothetical protein
MPFSRLRAASCLCFILSSACGAQAAGVPSAALVEGGASDPSFADSSAPADSGFCSNVSGPAWPDQAAAAEAGPCPGLCVLYSFPPPPPPPGGDAAVSFANLDPYACIVQ